MIRDVVVKQAGISAITIIVLGFAWFTIVPLLGLVFASDVLAVFALILGWVTYWFIGDKALRAFGVLH